MYLRFVVGVFRNTSTVGKKCGQTLAFPLKMQLMLRTPFTISG